MQLAILTAVLAAIAAAEHSAAPVVGLPWRLAVIASAILVAPCAALVGTHRLARSSNIKGTIDDAIGRLETIVAGIWLAAVALILLVGQWPSIVRANWQLAGWPLIDELLILLPVLAPLLLIWTIMHRLEYSLDEHASSTARPICLAQYLWLQTRHQLLLILVPPLAIISLFEIFLSLKIAPSSLDTAWWFILPLVGMMLILMPLAVRSLWQTAAMPVSPLRTRLNAVIASQRCSVRNILIWQTGGTMANAAVVGFSRWLRYLLLSDLLLYRISDDQIVAVVRHELAHLRRWHLPLRLAALLVPVAWWQAISRAWPESKSFLDAIGVFGGTITALALPLGLLTYTVLVVGWYSRLLEHDADLDACLDQHDRVDPLFAADFSAALIALCGRGHESLLNRWLHPSLEDRLALIRRAIASSDTVRVFRRRLASISVAIVGLLILAGLAAAFA